MVHVVGAGSTDSRMPLSGLLRGLQPLDEPTHPLSVMRKHYVYQTSPLCRLRTLLLKVYVDAQKLLAGALLIQLDAQIPLDSAAGRSVRFRGLDCQVNASLLQTREVTGPRVVCSGN